MAAGITNQITICKPNIHSQNPCHISWIKLKDGRGFSNPCLWNWKRGSEIDDEVGLQVADGNFSSVHDQIAAAENPRTGGDEGGAELQEHVKEVEEVGDGAEEGDDDGEAGVVGEASVAADVGEVEVERIDEESGDADDEEDVVPVRNDVGVRVEDLVAP